MDIDSNCMREEILVDDIFDALSDLDSETEYIHQKPANETPRETHSNKDEQFLQYFDALLEKILWVCCLENCICCEKIKKVIINHQQFSINSPPAIQGERVSNDVDFDDPFKADLEINNEKPQNKIQILSNIEIRRLQCDTNSTNRTFKGPSAMNERNLDQLFDELAGIKTQFEQDSDGPAGNSQKRRKNNIRKCTKRTKRSRVAKNLDISYSEPKMSGLNGNSIRRNDENNPNPNAVRQMLKFNYEELNTPNTIRRKSILKVASPEKRIDRNHSSPNLSQVTFDDDIQVIGETRRSNQSLGNYESKPKLLKSSKRKLKIQAKKDQKQKFNVKENSSITPGNKQCEFDKNSNESLRTQKRKLYSPEDWVNSDELDKYFDIE